LDFAEDFHRFTLEWDTTEIRWYVDDSMYVKQNAWYSSGAHYPAPFDKRFHLLLNVAVGGNWPGAPDATTSFPQRMYVDYVRVYRKK
jgi:beta-glucanase (GH16 family)